MEEENEDLNFIIIFIVNGIVKFNRDGSLNYGDGFRELLLIFV